MTQKFLCFFASVLLLSPLPLRAQFPEAEDSSPTLQPGDSVRILVWRQPELSGGFAVAPDGSISHPLYQEIRVADLPISAVEERLATFLRRYEADPQFVIEPLLRVATGGEVRAPNLYSLPAGTTVAQAVIAAGGPTERGRMDRVRLLRGGDVIRGDLTDPQDPMFHTPVFSGDQIIVPRRRSVFQDIVLPMATVSGSIASFGALLTLLF